MDFTEDFNLLEIYSDYVKEPFFLNLEEIIDLFDTSSIEKTKERIKILFTENAEFLTEKLNAFTRIVESEGYHVSVGYEIQNAGSIQMSALIKVAENKMYQAKQEFYSQNPAVRRRHPRCAPDTKKALSPQ